MHVYVTREYQEGEESGEQRAYASLEAAQRFLETPTRHGDRILWREAYPGRWIGRISGRFMDLSLYVDRLEVLE